jgi:hypothetical protein
MASQTSHQTSAGKAAAQPGSLNATLLYFGGMLATFTGERLIGAGTARWLTLVGVLMVLGAIALRFLRAGRATGEAQQTERQILFLYALGTGALLLYFLQSDLFATPFGKPLEHDSPKLAGALAALWPAVWVASAFPLLLVEIAYAAVARAPRLEIGRIRDAVFTGFGLAGAIIFAFSAYYVSSERDKKLDLSYFRTARPGESTRKIVRSLDQPITVSIFYPPANEVREEVYGYFSDLAKESKLLEVKSYDQAVDPQKAKEVGVSGNGVVAISRGTRKELLSVGLELESSRTQLKNLDKEAQKRLLQVARPARNVYLTTGHGERTFDPTSDTDKRLTLKDLRDLMTQQSYTVRSLGAAEGLATDVPNDASVVMIIGPTKEFLPEETQSIARYLERGGRLLVALDPDGAADAGVDLDATLKLTGLHYNKTILANDQIYARRTQQQVDRTNIATGSYSSHPSVTSLSHLGMRAPMVLFGAGSLEEVKGKDASLSIDFSVRAHPATWMDTNKNFTYDTGEVKKAYNLAAAVVKKKAGGKPAEEMRALVVADSDAVADTLITNPGNAYFVLDGLKWLVGDEGITGEISSEADVPITHTRKQDVTWFYTSIFGVPALVLGFGWSMSARRRRSRRAAPAKKAAAQKEAA